MKFLITIQRHPHVVFTLILSNVAELVQQAYIYIGTYKKGVCFRDIEDCFLTKCKNTTEMFNKLHIIVCIFYELDSLNEIRVI